MSQPTTSNIEAQTLADDVRSSEQLYLDAAMKCFKERFGMEYYRLRAYAFESGHKVITLNVRVKCDFKKRTVTVESVPEFIPEEGVTQRQVPEPKNHES